MTLLYYEEQLHKIFANVNEWLKYAEAKNFGLITINGAIILGISQINFGSYNQIKLCLLLHYPAVYIFILLFCITFIFPNPKQNHLKAKS